MPNHDYLNGGILPTILKLTCQINELSLNKPGLFQAA